MDIRQVAQTLLVSRLTSALERRFGTRS